MLQCIYHYYYSLLNTIDNALQLHNWRITLFGWFSRKLGFKNFKHEN